VATLKCVYTVLGMRRGQVWQLARRLVWVVALGLELKFHAADARQRRSTAKAKSNLAADATQLLRSGRNNEAAAMFDRALAASTGGGSADLHYNRAVALQTVVPPRLEEAVWSWQMSIRLEPDDTPAVTAHTHYTLALGLQGLNRFAEALEPLHEVLARAPDRYALEAQALECSCRHHLAPDEATRKVGPGGSDEYGQALRALHEGALRLCEQAIAFELEEQVSTPATRAFERRGLVMAVHNSHKILGDLSRLSEAQHFMDAALMLTPDHKPIEMAIDRLLPQIHDTNILMHGQDRNVSTLTLLWPTGTEDYDALSHGNVKLGQDGPLLDALLKTFPFALVSHVPGSTPPVLPLYTPVWLSSGNDQPIMNKYLLEAVLRMSSEEPRGAVVSNVGGWQSARNFFETVLPAQKHVDAIRALHVHVLESVKSMISALGLDATDSHVSIRESWANVNQKHDWNEEVRTTAGGRHCCTHRLMCVRLSPLTR
jgi:tetratricopeptide (TPR) repeat protein